MYINQEKSKHRHPPNATKEEKESKHPKTMLRVLCLRVLDKKTKGKRKEHAVSQNPKTPLLYAAEIAPKVTSSIHLNIHWQ
jgi:transposase